MIIDIFKTMFLECNSLGFNRDEKMIMFSDKQFIYILDKSNLEIKSEDEVWKDRK